jgi:hypothetical protein
MSPFDDGHGSVLPAGRLESNLETMLWVSSMR